MRGWRDEESGNRGSKERDEYRARRDHAGACFGMLGNCLDTRWDEVLCTRGQTTVGEGAPVLAGSSAHLVAWFGICATAATLGRLDTLQYTEWRPLSQN